MYRIIFLFIVGILSLPGLAQDYPINVSTTQNYTNVHSRHLDGITLNSGDGAQSFTISEPRKVYTSLLDKSFKARAGEQVTAAFNFSGSWMNGFVYLDRGNDGSFDAELLSNGTFATNSDIMAFSYAEPVLGGAGYNSNGVRLTGDAINVLNPPAFNIPSDIAPGYYRMRYKVDWASIDPAGRVGDSNDILKNGGAFCDIRINIHGDYCNITTSATGGEILSVNGVDLNGTQSNFGEALKICLHPEEGYVLDGLTIRHGYNLDGVQFIHGNQQYTEETMPGFLVSNNEYTIPAEQMDGDVRISATFRELNSGSSGDDYPYLGSVGSINGTAQGIIAKFTSNATIGGASEITVSDALQSYRDLTSGQQLSIVPGDAVTLRVYGQNNSELTSGNKIYLYIDLNQDGQFTSALNTDGTPTISGELIAYNNYNGKNSLGATSTTSLPSFTIPGSMPLGIYRARLVGGANEIDPTGATGNPTTTTDFLINIHRTTHPLTILTKNGSVNSSGISGLPEQASYNVALTLIPQPVADGYEADEMIIRHGHNLDGAQYIHGNCQWNEYSVSASGSYTLPKEYVNGEVRVTVDFTPTADAEYTLVFSDEFNGNDGELPDASKWGRSTRYSSTWNRWLAKTDEEYKLTGFINDGAFVARAVPNPFTATDNVPMITGGIETAGKFSFTYGKVECRIKTNPWSGNFPAFWMMPARSATWPEAGEIDIWEVIDAQTTTFHTVHTKWTYVLNNKTNPQSSFSLYGYTQENYHTLALEWDETSLTWYVDGSYAGRYNKSTSTSALNQGQWPFDGAFYLILNQSVGDGSWAARADESHTYETKFDWVRVYQKDGQTNTGGADIELPKVNDFSVYTSQGTIHLSAEQPVHVTICDLSGRVVWSEMLDDVVEVPVQNGFYIVNGKKVIVF